MQLRSLVLAAMASLCATSAHAIHINQQTFVANGGNLQNIPGTAGNVFDKLRTASLAPQFLGVGNLAGCTGTWLGTEGNHAWVLTAAHCVPTTTEERDVGHLTFRDAENRPLAGGAGSRAYVHPFRINPPAGMTEASTDIALLRMPLLPAAFTTTLPSTPYLNDRPLAIGTTVSMVGHGTAAVANTPVDAHWPTQGVRRVWGESRLDRVQDNDRVGVSNFSPLQSTTHWARAGVGDGGAAWWQRPSGEWTVVATTNGGHATSTTGALVAPYASWIKLKFPGAKLLSERLRVTESTKFVSHNFSHDVTWRNITVSFVVAPNQPGVIGPTHLTYRGHRANTLLEVPVRHAATGQEGTMKLRAARITCGAQLAIEDAAMCGTDQRSGALHLWYDHNDNRSLPKGRWLGRVAFDARSWQERSLNDRVEVDIDIDRSEGLRGTVKLGEPYRSPEFAPMASRGTVYFVVAPNQPGVTGPTSGTWTATKTYSTLSVATVDAVTGASRPIKLRAHRIRSCGWLAMEDAVACNGWAEGALYVWFDPQDNPGLPAGVHRGSAIIDARGWHDPAFAREITLDVEIDTYTQKGKVTRTQNYWSPNFALEVDHGTVYYLVAPNQAGVTGPRKGIWSHAALQTVITVPVVNAANGAATSVKLRARRTTSACGSFQMENAIRCSTQLREGPLHVWFDAKDNPALPAGLHRGTLHIDVHGWHRPLQRGIKLDVEIDTRS